MKKVLLTALGDVPLFRKVERLRGTIVLSLIFILCTLNLRSQWVSIPDSNFGTWLNTNGYAACMQGSNSLGWQMDTSCPAVVGDTMIWCINSSITDLTGIQYFDNLRHLACYYNELTTLPPLPSGLIELACHNNQLSSLPALPDSLQTLHCGNNPLHSLPVLPNTLAVLSCFNSQLSTLPALPNNLNSLYCQDNLLSSLPPLPDSLRFLYCPSNLLSSLPALPNSLTDLYCDNNQLTSLPEFPDSLSQCHIYNNPIRCLPQLKRIETFYFYNTLVSCLPNYGNVTSSSPALNTVPLCDEYNPNGCDIFWSISGKIYYDGDNNCFKDVADSSQKNIKIQLWSGGNFVRQTFTGGEGVYAFDTDSLGNYSAVIDTSNIPFQVSCPANGIQSVVVTSLDSFYHNRDFAFECKAGFDLAAQSVVGRFRPGRMEILGVHAGDLANFYGGRCANGISGVVILSIGNSVSYVSHASGALAPTTVVGNVITWNIADFGMVNFFTDFNIMVRTDTNAAIGTKVCFTLIVTPSVGDNNPANNTLTHCITIVASIDPNNKEVYPEGDIDTTQKWLTYTINFQNTGTDTAQHIYVTDTLDSDLDASSFQLLAYSHQPMVQIKENAVRFNFPNINLPDSNTNEPLSHGYVQYKVKLKDNLPIGTQINNTAYIYFDFNAPVVTNTTSNVISTTTGITDFGLRNADFGLNPNPASDAVSISVDERMIGGTVTVSDVTGRKVLISNPETSSGQVIEHRMSNIETARLSNAVYFVTVADKEGRSVTKKLVISR